MKTILEKEVSTRMRWMLHGLPSDKKGAVRGMAIGFSNDVPPAGSRCCASSRRTSSIGKSR